MRRGPATFDFNDNTGYTSLFDGTLKGWNFDKAFWNIQDGAIHIAATCEKPTGTVYAISDAGEYGDFILKYEMKGTGNINGGMQFRSYIVSDTTAAGVHFPPVNGQPEEHHQTVLPLQAEPTLLRRVRQNAPILAYHLRASHRQSGRWLVRKLTLIATTTSRA